MRKKMLVMMLLLAMPLVLGSSAYADLISIGLQEPGVNGGAITTLVTGSGALDLLPTPYGSFPVNQVSAQDELVLGPPGLLDSQSLNASSRTGGVLTVWVTAQGLSASGVIPFVSSFAVNRLTGSITSVTESTFFSPTNALYGGTALNTWTFTGIGTAGPFTTPETVSGLYSVTEEYTITDAGGRRGSANVTMDLAGAVPEPGSLGLLGAGLLGIALKLRKIILY